MPEYGKTLTADNVMEELQKPWKWNTTKPKISLKRSSAIYCQSPNDEDRFAGLVTRVRGNMQSLETKAASVDDAPRKDLIEVMMAMDASNQP